MYLLQTVNYIFFTAVFTWHQVEETQTCETSPTPLNKTWNELVQQTLGVTIQPKMKKTRHRNRKNATTEEQPDQDETISDGVCASNSLQGNYKSWA